MRIFRKSPDISRSVHCLWRDPHCRDGWSAAVSLHSHTLHSREGLAFVPRVLRKFPVAYAALQALEMRHRHRKGRPIPFDRAFWRPPLHPNEAHGLECAQIWKLLGLQPLISITDHDNLEACTELRAIGIEAPYSLEWTVPYHGTVFHIGVHNMPPEWARELQAAMAAATLAPTRERIADLLAALHSMRDVLLVLNHPFSCEMLMERKAHIQLLGRFLGEFGGWMHALELNGLQPASSNLDTMRLAAARAMPVISGGDRHCCEPNANLNLTCARTFTEFVHEIRDDQRTSVVFMPQYRDSIATRYVEFIWQALGSYPDFKGRERWLDRVFLQCENGETVTFASLWPDGGSTVIRAFVSLVGLLASPGMRAMLSVAGGRDAKLEPEIP